MKGCARLQWSISLFIPSSIGCQSGYSLWEFPSGTLYHYPLFIQCAITLVGLEFNGPDNTIKVMSVYLITLFPARLSHLRGLPIRVHIRSPETDPWISGREKMTVDNSSWSISTKECCRTRRDRIHDLLITSRKHIRLCHRGLYDIWKTGYA